MLAQIITLYMDDRCHHSTETMVMKHRTLSPFQALSPSGDDQAGGRRVGSRTPRRSLESIDFFFRLTGKMDTWA